VCWSEVGSGTVLSDVLVGLEPVEKLLGAMFVVNVWILILARNR
jgi:hypothetical protein